LEELTMAVLSRKSALKKQKEQEEAERLFREMLSRREVLVLGSPFADLPEEREDRWLPLTPENLKLAIARAVGNKPLKAALERLEEELNLNGGCGDEDGGDEEVVIGGVKVRKEELRTVQEVQAMLEKLKLKIPIDEFGVVENGWLLPSPKFDKLVAAVNGYESVRARMREDFEKFRDFVGTAWTDRNIRGFCLEESKIAVRIKEFGWTANKYLRWALEDEYRELIREYGIRTIVVKRFKYGKWLFAAISRDGVVRAEGLPREFVGYLINRKKQLGIKWVEVVQ
ncbi:MAG: hypothetical protein ACXQT6_00330, partial [Candidatus Methanospirareceae archaeon]